MADNKEKNEQVAPVEKPETKLEKKNRATELVIEDSKVYKAEVVERFGSTSKGSVIEKKGSIIKVLVAQKLVKII